MNKQAVIGKFTLDSLSAGMYNHPYLIIREYIQNSTDAIDEAVESKIIKQSDAKIDITIDGRKKSMEIYDNGIGVRAKDAWHVLHDIGNSEKDLSVHRGFRGIGRLGGIGHCQRLIFETKAKGEHLISKSTWDCDKLRKLVARDDRYKRADSIIHEIVDFNQNQYEGNAEDHFFHVELCGLQSSRNRLINVPGIREYISQNAPVSFNYDSFSFAGVIEEKLKEYVPGYTTYPIYLNGKSVYKPYSDLFPIRSKGKGKINNIIFKKFKNDEDLVAFAWIAETELRGSLNRITLMDGIRLRQGNILIGDKNLLSEFFREKRFNLYMIGEIHTVDNNLIPNSRRDDFEDNKTKDNLISCFIKEIGLPYSRKIRQASKERSLRRRKLEIKDLINEINKILRQGYYSEKHKENIVSELINLDCDNITIQKQINIEETIEALQRAKHFLDMNSHKMSNSDKKMLKIVFEIIYRVSTDENNAKKMVTAILHEIK